MKSTLKDVDLLRPRGFAAVVLVALSLAITGAGAVRMTTNADKLPADVAFAIGDRQVTIDQLDQRVHTLSALYSIKVPTAGDQLSTFRRDSAKSMAVSMILDAEAQRRGVRISDAEAELGLNSVVKSNLGGSQARFATFLGDNGISKSDVLDEIVRTLETTALYKEVTGSIAQPTAAEVKADFDAHRGQMKAPERRTIRNIVVDSPAAAKAAIRRIRSGRPFAEVAAAASLDKSTSGRGGLLGTVAAQDLDDAYAKVAFTAKRGVVFGPVRSATGWNVGIVEAIKPSYPLTFAQVQKTLASALWSDRKLKAWNEWLATTIKAAHVRYADDYLPANPDAAPSLAPTEGS
ncbi:peptidylprolyl isomerase [Nocardioides ultimimeridianus]